MRRAIPLALLTSLVTVACGSSSDDPPANAGQGGAGGTGGAAGSATTQAFTCPEGLSLSPGKNTGIKIGDRTRTFTIDFPKETTAPVAVVFQWHGFGDTAENFSAGLALKPDADPDFPFIRVVPEDLSLLPAQGLDWALFDAGTPDDPNNDLELFSAITGCLQRDHAADPNRLYAVGFSAGAIMTNLLHAKFPTELAATVAYSGAWFNDEAESKAVNALGYPVVYDWPPLTPGKAAPMLITHGGPKDTFYFNNQKVIDFEVSAQNAIPFLKAAGRDVIACAHTLGHTPPPEVSSKVVIEFFKANVRGKPSAWAETLPDTLPKTCTR